MGPDGDFQNRKSGLGSHENPTVFSRPSQRCSGLGQKSSYPSLVNERPHSLLAQASVTAFSQYGQTHLLVICIILTEAILHNSLLKMPKSRKPKRRRTKDHEHVRRGPEQNKRRRTGGHEIDREGSGDWDLCVQQTAEDVNAAENTPRSDRLGALKERGSRLENFITLESSSEGESDEVTTIRARETEALMGVRYPFPMPLRHTETGGWICLAHKCQKDFTRMDHMRKHISKETDYAHVLLSELLSKTECSRCNMNFEGPRLLAQHRGQIHKGVIKNLRLGGALAIFGDWQHKRASPSAPLSNDNTPDQVRLRKPFRQRRYMPLQGSKNKMVTLTDSEGSTVYYTATSIHDESRSTSEMPNSERDSQSNNPIVEEDLDYSNLAAQQSESTTPRPDMIDRETAPRAALSTNSMNRKTDNSRESTRVGPVRARLIDQMKQ